MPGNSITRHSHLDSWNPISTNIFSFIILKKMRLFNYFVGYEIFTKGVSVGMNLNPFYFLYMNSLYQAEFNQITHQSNAFYNPIVSFGDHNHQDRLFKVY
jgi:hypothetical protein